MSKEIAKITITVGEEVEGKSPLFVEAEGKAVDSLYFIGLMTKILNNANNEK